MVYTLDDRLVIGVSARALFDLSFENKIYEESGLDAYAAYQTICNTTSVLQILYFIYYKRRKRNCYKGIKYLSERNVGKGKAQHSKVCGKICF